MSKGDKIDLDDMHGEVTATGEGTYTVRWATGETTFTEMTYDNDVTWEDWNDGVDHTAAVRPHTWHGNCSIDSPCRGSL